MLRTLPFAAAFLLAVPQGRAANGLQLSQDGLTVYDSANNITWLADLNLPATNRFGLPVCGPNSDLKTCVNASGSMTYEAAAAWVAAMNAANYLGHNDWQIPTTPSSDPGCAFIGNDGNSFAWGCTAGALGSLYYKAFGMSPPNNTLPVSKGSIGPFSNFQPYYYWSQSNNGGGGHATLSFNTGFHDSNTDINYMYVLPMIPGKIPGSPAVADQGLQVSSDKQTVYDPETDVTWLANANLAATNSFGIAVCKDQNTPKPCVAQDGSMNFNSAAQFIANMNSASYLGQKNWQLPTITSPCPNYNCDGTNNPLGNLYYDQLGLPEGTPVSAPPDTTVGPFIHLQPYIYWSCLGDAIQKPCSSNPAASGFQFCFSFGNGFLGTDIFNDDYYVTSYFPGTRTATNGPTIAYVANAEGESPAIAPNTWVEIKGVNLAPSGDARIWQGSDFSGTQMPTQLDKVSATVNGKSAYVYYIGPTQINILTPPDAISGAVQLVVTDNGATAAAFTAQAQALSPSFFVFNGGPYLAAVHLNTGLIGPTSLYPGSSTPAKPGETIVLYANGFGATSVPVVSGSSTQAGALATLPVIQIGNKNATVQFAGLVAPGQFQFNVVVPSNIADGDQPIVATYGGLSTQAGTLITIQH